MLCQNIVVDFLTFIALVIKTTLNNSNPFLSSIILQGTFLLLTDTYNSFSVICFVLCMVLHVWCFVFGDRCFTFGVVHGPWFLVFS